MEEPKRTSEQRTNLKYVCGINVKNKRYSVRPTDTRPSHISESASKAERKFQMLPVEVPCEQPTLVFLSFDDPMSTNEGDFQMHVDLINTNPNYSKRADVLWLNPFSCYFMATENPPGRVTVRVYEKGRHIGSKELRYQAKQSELSATITELLLRSVRLLCDELLRLGTTTEHLDQLLTSVFDSDEENALERFFVPYRYLDNNGINSFVPGALEFPTLLHLAAKYGFSELCCRLTDLPDVHYGYRLTNFSGCLPEDIATRMGHDQLARLLETFREVRDGLESAYVACRYSQVNNNDDEHYLAMHSFETRKSSGDEQFLYLFEDQESHDSCEGEGEHVDDRNCPFRKTTIEENKMETEVDGKSPVECSSVKLNLQPILNAEEGESGSVVTSLTKSDESFLYTSSQQELLSLMNQVKNQVLTIAEAEVLFKEWKLRFHDKSASFKQKQATLAKMRLELSHLQTHLKKGFFNKIVSRLKPTKPKRTVSNCQSNDITSKENCDEIYCVISEELENIRIEETLTNRRMTILDSSGDQSSLPSPSPPPPPLFPRSRSPENSDSEQREMLDESNSDDGSYVIPDSLDDEYLSPHLYECSQQIFFAHEFSQNARLSSETYDYPRTMMIRSEQDFPHPSQNRSLSLELAESPHNAPEVKPRLPVRANPINLKAVLYPPLRIDKRIGELDESHYLSLISSPSDKHSVEFDRGQANVPAKAQTLNPALMGLSTERKWFSSSRLNRPEVAEAAAVAMTPASGPRKPIRRMTQDCLSSSLPTSSVLMTRTVSQEAKELCGSTVKKEITKWRQD